MGTENGGGCGGAGFRIRGWKLFAPAPKNELRFGMGFARRAVAGHIATNAEPDKTPLQQACKSPKTRLRLHFFRTPRTPFGKAIASRFGADSMGSKHTPVEAGGREYLRTAFIGTGWFQNLTCNQEPAAASVQSGGGRHFVRHKEYRSAGNYAGLYPLFL